MAEEFPELRASPEFVRLTLESISSFEDELLTILVGDTDDIGTGAAEQFIDGDLLSAQVNGFHNSTFLPRIARATSALGVKEI